MADLFTKTSGPQPMIGTPEALGARLKAAGIAAQPPAATAPTGDKPGAATSAPAVQETTPAPDPVERKPEVTATESTTSPSSTTHTASTAPVATATEPEPKEENLFEGVDWGHPATSTTAQADPAKAAEATDWKRISEAAGREVKSHDDLAAAFRNLQEENKRLAESAKLLDPRLAAAQAAAAKGVDPLQYLKLTTTDYKKIPAKDLVALDLVAQGMYPSEQEAYEALEDRSEWPERVIMAEGKRIREKLEADDHAKLAELERGSQAERSATREAFLKKAEAAVQGFTGHKLLGMTDEQASQVMSRYKSELHNDTFPSFLWNADGTPNMEKMVAAKFWLEHGPRAVEHIRQTAKKDIQKASTEAKGEQMRSMSNAAPLNPKGVGAKPEGMGERVQKLGGELAGMRNGGGLTPRRFHN